MLRRDGRVRHLLALAGVVAQLTFADECSIGEVSLPDGNQCPLTVSPTCTGTLVHGTDGLECDGTWCVAAEHEDVCSENDHGSGPSAIDECLQQFDQTFPIGRIVGGEEIKVPRKYPFLVSIVWSNQMHFCGGTLIDPEWVLTAAHCVDWFSAGAPVTVQIGVHDRSEIASDSCVENIPIAAITIHASYSSETLANDIALVKLQAPSAYPLVVGISAAVPRNFEHLVTAGWGALESDGPSPTILHEADLIYLDRSACISDSLHQERWLLSGMTCAWFPERDSCQGDSGGPLFRIAKNRENPAPRLFHLVGIVSWGMDCALPGWPGVYADVHSYLPWLANQLPPTVYHRLVFSDWTPDEPPLLTESGGPFEVAEKVPCEALAGSFSATEGTVSYPADPRDYYANDQSCVFEIRAPAGHHVQLDFSRFELEFLFDFLRVYEGDAGNDTLLAILTGVSALNKPRSVDITAASWLDILNRTDSSSAAAKFDNEDEVRDKALRRKKADLQRQQEVPGATSIERHLLEVQLRHMEYLIESQPLSHAELTRRRQASDFAGYLGYPATTVYIASPNVTLRFESDATVVDRGYALHWSSVDPLRGNVAACDDSNVLCIGDPDELEVAQSPAPSDGADSGGDGDDEEDAGHDGDEQEDEDKGDSEEETSGTNGTTTTTTVGSGRSADNDGVTDNAWSVGAIALLVIILVVAVGAVMALSWWTGRREVVTSGGASQQPPSTATV